MARPGQRSIPVAFESELEPGALDPDQRERRGAALAAEMRLRPGDPRKNKRGLGGGSRVRTGYPAGDGEDEGRRRSEGVLTAAEGGAARGPSSGQVRLKTRTILFEGG